MASEQDGAGIYLETGSILRLSGSPDFGGAGFTDSWKDTLSDTAGNFKTEHLIGQKNGGLAYSKPRQDIFIEETQEMPASIVVAEALRGEPGSIWVWAAPH